ncbi:proteolipid protein 2 isoform X2 [Tamandua tetradactyla]|uniref:proteolipid protein 2 isoform X2 n=1 Tax=Tamandua tetradactyla TaxID=48850 RepID=UPI0040539AB2
MADSERLSAPGCWAACTNFSRTRKGILLFAEIILCLVILICYSASYSYQGYSSLSVVEMILAAIFFIIYMCDLHTKIQFINWPWSDFFRSLIATILYLITSIVVLVHKGNYSKITAGILGLIATALFGYDAFVTFPLRQQRHTAAPTDPADGSV